MRAQLTSCITKRSKTQQRTSRSLTYPNAWQLMRVRFAPLRQSLLRRLKTSRAALLQAMRSKQVRFALMHALTVVGTRLVTKGLVSRR